MSGKCRAHFDNDDNGSPTKLRRMCKHIESESLELEEAELGSCQSVSHGCGQKSLANAAALHVPSSVSTEDVPTTSLQKKVSHGNGGSDGNRHAAAREEAASALTSASLTSAPATTSHADDGPPPVVNHHDGSGPGDGGNTTPASSSESEPEPGPIHCSIRVQRMITVTIDNRFCCRYFFQHSFSGALTPRHPDATFWG